MCRLSDTPHSLLWTRIGSPPRRSPHSGTPETDKDLADRQGESRSWLCLTWTEQNVLVTPVFTLLFHMKITVLSKLWAYLGLSCRIWENSRMWRPEVVSEHWVVWRGWTWGSSRSACKEERMFFVDLIFVCVWVFILKLKEEHDHICSEKQINNSRGDPEQLFFLTFFFITHRPLKIHLSPL